MLRGSCPNLNFNFSATEESRTIDPLFDAHKKVAAARGGALLGDYMGRGLVDQETFWRRIDPKAVGLPNGTEPGFSTLKAHRAGTNLTRPDIAAIYGSLIDRNRLLGWMGFGHFDVIVIVVAGLDLDALKDTIDERHVFLHLPLAVQSILDQVPSRHQKFARKYLKNFNSRDSLRRQYTISVHGIRDSLKLTAYEERIRVDAALQETIERMSGILFARLKSRMPYYLDEKIWRAFLQWNASDRPPLDRSSIFYEAYQIACSDTGTLYERERAFAEALSDALKDAIIPIEADLTDDSEFSPISSEILELRALNSEYMACVLRLINAPGDETLLRELSRISSEAGCMPLRIDDRLLKRPDSPRDWKRRSARSCANYFPTSLAPRKSDGVCRRCSADGDKTLSVEEVRMRRWWPRGLDLQTKTHEKVGSASNHQPSRLA